VAQTGFDGINAVIQPASLTVPRFLPEDPLKLLKQGKFMKIPVIHGANRNEGSFIFGLMYNDFMKVNNLTNDTTFLETDCIATMLRAFHIDDPTDGVTDTISNKYFFNVDTWDMDSMYPGLEDVTGLFGMKAGTKQMADWWSRAGADAWLYSFQHRGLYTMATFFFIGSHKLPFDTGVTHADELIYLFPMPLMSLLPPKDRHVSDMMVEMWTNFAKYGNPTPPEHPSEHGVPHWPTVSQANSYLEITQTPTVKHDFSQTFDIAVQSSINSTVTTTPAPTTTPSPTTTPQAPTTTPGSTMPPPATSTEYDWHGKVDSLTSERDTFRGATAGLAVVAALAVLVVIVAVVMLRRRSPVSAGEPAKSPTGDSAL